MEKMDETVPGGLYLSSDGETYHDAHGNVLSAEEVAKRKNEVAKEPVKQVEEPSTEGLVAEKKPAKKKSEE